MQTKFYKITYDWHLSYPSHGPFFFESTAVPNHTRTVFASSAQVTWALTLCHAMTLFDWPGSLTVKQTTGSFCPKCTVSGKYV